MSLEDITRYQNGALAGLFSSSKQDSIYVNGALYELASSMGIEEEAKGFIDGAMASREGVKTAIGVYSEKYQHALEDVNIEDLQTHYNEFIEGYLDEEKVGKINGELLKFSKEKFGDISKKIKRSEYILKGKDTYDFSDGEKEEAKATIEKYKNLVTILETLEQIKFEQLRPNAVRRSQKNLLETITEGL